MLLEAILHIAKEMKSKQQTIISRMIGRVKILEPYSGYALE